MRSKLLKYAALSVVAATAAVLITVDSFAMNGTQPPSPLYTMRDYDGRIAIFKQDATAPDTVLDVYTDTLPIDDREQLKTGIAIHSEQELQRLIEDYDG